jgi:hypothetical protein
VCENKTQVNDKKQEMKDHLIVAKIHPFIQHRWCDRSFKYLTYTVPYSSYTTHPPPQHTKTPPADVTHYSLTTS